MALGQPGRVMSSPSELDPKAKVGNDRCGEAWSSAMWRSAHRSGQAPELPPQRNQSRTLVKNEGERMCLSTLPQLSSAISLR